MSKWRDWDNRVKEGPWSDGKRQYEFYRDIFRVHDDQIMLRHLEKKTVWTRIWFERPGDPSKREYFKIGRNLRGGSEWIGYDFKFPPGYWFADQTNRAYEGECYSYYYRLDFRGGVWGIALRFWKQRKTPEEITNMCQLGIMYIPILTKFRIRTLDFRPTRDTDKEAIFLYIDVTSQGIDSLYDAHLEWIRKAGEQGLW